MNGLLIECKRTKERDLFLDYIRCSEVKSKLVDWWDKVDDEARMLEKDPLLVIWIVGKGYICVYGGEYLLEKNTGDYDEDREPDGFNDGCGAEICTWKQFKIRFGYLRLEEKND